MESSGCLPFVDVLMLCQPNLGVQKKYSHWPLFGLRLLPSTVSQEVSSQYPDEQSLYSFLYHFS